MTKISFKRGQTFVVYCQRLDANGNPVDLTGVGVTATIGGPGFSESLTTAITDSANGKFTLSAPSSTSAAWPVMALAFDVAFDHGTYVVISDSVTVNISDNVTPVSSASTGLPGQSGNPLVFQDAPQTTGTIGAGANVQTGSVAYQFAASYMGALAADPATRTDGSALREGDIYWNTAAKEQRTFNGTNWQVVYTPSPSVTSNISYTGTLTGGTGIVNIGGGQLYKDASGNIGIGTSSLGGSPPKVSIAATGSSYLGIVINGRAFIGNDGASKTSLFGQGGGAYLELGAQDRVIFATGGTIGSAAERARIDASGNVGIGTSSPSARLEVAYSNDDDGFVIRNIARGGKYRFLTSGISANFLSLQSYNGSAYDTLLLAGAGYFAVSTGAAGATSERLRVDSNGSTLLATTSPGLQSNSSCTLQKVSSSVFTQTINHIGSASGAAFLQFGYSGAKVGSITVNTVSSVSYNTTSDQRAKMNIRDAEDAGLLIDAVQVRQHDWRADGSHQRYGFISQELALVFPEAVSVPEDPDEMQGVDYSKLVPMLTKEIQSLRKRVAMLEAA